MNRAVWIILIVVVAAVAVWGITRNGSADTMEEIQAASELGTAQERIDALVDIAMSDRRFDSDEYKAISSGISDAAYEAGEGARLVAVCDSLLALPLPTELTYRLEAELHGGLVIQGYYAEDGREAYWRRASEVAKSLLEHDDVPPDVMLQVAGFHLYALGFAPPDEVLATRDQWTAYDLASRAFPCLDSPVSMGDATILSGALGGALDRISTAYGADRAIVVSDSLLATGPCPSMRAVMLEQRYWVSADSDTETAVTAARGLLDVGHRPGMWSLLRAVSLDMSERDLAPATALDLAESALDLVDSRRDSGLVYFALGVAERDLHHYDLAATALEKAIEMGEEAPEIADPRVAALLEVYEESSQPDKAIDLLSRLMARSILPNEEARDKLAELLEAEGRSSAEIPALVEAQRYVGVPTAPDFTLVDRDGNDVTLSDLRGNVVLMCFWSYG